MLREPSSRPLPLVEAITSFLGDQDAARLTEIRDRLHLEIGEAGDAALDGLKNRLADAPTKWEFHPHDPLARRIHHLLAESLLATGSVFTGLEHITAVANDPVVVFANHLSYADANLLEILLHRFGAPALADRLTAIAGPKVYTSRTRRFSSLCYGTIRTPQNSGVASEDAVMTAREVAVAAQRSIGVALDRVRLGEALLLFAEGTRSRTAEMQRLLMGAMRYLDVPATRVLPIGIVGTESMFPVGEGVFRAVPIAARAGQPIEVQRLRDLARGNRRLMVDAIGVAIAEVLPDSYRGAYGSDAPDIRAARHALAEVRSSTPSC